MENSRKNEYYNYNELNECCVLSDGENNVKYDSDGGNESDKENATSVTRGDKTRFQFENENENFSWRNTRIPSSERVSEYFVRINLCYLLDCQIGLKLLLNQCAEICIYTLAKHH